MLRDWSLYQSIMLARATQWGRVWSSIVGASCANWKLRPDTRSHYLHYPQLGIVKTNAMEAVGFDDRLSGQNFVVAVQSTRATTLKMLSLSTRTRSSEDSAEATFSAPTKLKNADTRGGKKINLRYLTRKFAARGARKVYANLDEDGFVNPEAEVQPNDVLVGKTSRPPRISKSHGARWHHQPRKG